MYLEKNIWKKSYKLESSEISTIDTSYVNAANEEQNSRHRTSQSSFSAVCSHNAKIQDTVKSPLLSYTEL